MHIDTGIGYQAYHGAHSLVLAFVKDVSDTRRYCVT